MRLQPKTAGGFAAGAFLFLLIFGIGWPGPGTWLLVFALLFLAAAAAAWWLDASALHGARTVAVSGGAQPFPQRGVARGRGAARRAGPRRGDSLLLSLGLPGPDAHGRWVLPDTVHITALAALTGLLALIIFISSAIGDDGSPQSKPVPTVQPNAALDFSRPVTPALGPTTTAAATTGAQAAPSGSATTSTTDPAPIVVDTPSTPRPAPAQPVNAVPIDQTPQNSITHVVVEGDTIYDLAITYNSTIDAIVLANDISEYDTLDVGQDLIIPVP